MPPFALLGVFHIDISYLLIRASMQDLQQTSGQIDSVVFYLVFIVGLEFLLRIVSPILAGIRSLEKNRLKRLLTGAGVTASPKHLLYNAATAMDATVGGVSYGQSQ